MNWVRTAAVMGFLGVALGAFGAHGLEEKLQAAGRMETWETAVLYHLVHAVVLLAMAGFAGERLKGACWAMFVGVIVFSGTLYALCLTGVTMLGAVTPLGGVALLVGWGWMALKAGREVS